MTYNVSKLLEGRENGMLEEKVRYVWEQNFINNILLEKKGGDNNFDMNLWKRVKKYCFISFVAESKPITVLATSGFI